MQPSTSVKSAVMHTIYSAQAELHKKFVLVDGENVEGCNILEDKKTLNSKHRTPNSSYPLINFLITTYPITARSSSKITV